MKKKQFKIVSGFIAVWKSKLFFTMKLTVIALCFSVFQGFALTTFGQNARVNLNMKNVSIKQILGLIEDQTNFFFMYNGKLVNVEKKISVTAEDKDINDVLKDVFAGTDITYDIVNRQILLSSQEGKSGNIGQQQKSVTGRVTDSAGNPLPGVTVFVKGTTKGTITDSEGKYSIDNVSDNVVIQFSFVGMKAQGIPVAGKSTIDVIMLDETVGIEEVVAIGYGSMKKSDLTGSVTSANLEALKGSPSTNVVQLLQGTVPGLNIGQVTSAGSTPDISIRGTNTISGNTSILIVLDGIIYSNSLSSINPNDIESIDILKDASSTAVYGARAANGVMLITSKKGKAGKAKISYTSSYSIQNPSKNLRPMNRKELLDFVTDNMYDKAYTKESGYTQANPDFKLASWMPDGYMLNSDGTISTTDFNWWDACTRTGSILDNQLSMSGGNDAVSYLLSLGNSTQKNFLLNDDFKRNSVRVNLDAKPRSWWKVGVQASGSFVNQDGAEPILWTLITMSPLATPYNADGTLNRSPMNVARDNPLLGSVVDDRERHNYFIGNLYSEFQLPIKGLTYRINFGNNYQVNEHYQGSMYNFGGLGEAYKQNSSTFDYTLDNIVNYSRTFGVHNIAATFVYGAFERNYSYTEAKANTFTRMTLGYNSLEQGTNQFASSDANSEAMLYQMARFNYKYNNKYLVTATLRRDGYSGFAANHKSALFPSVALGWVVSDESFFKIPVINYLKLRGGYGISGNQTFIYSSLSKVSAGAGYVFGDGGTTVMKQELTSMANNDLKWERTAGLNLGFDFGLVKNRVSGSLEVYKTTTRDLLYAVAIPSITGFTSITSNIGEIQNKGIEFSVTSRNLVTPDFVWSTTFNISSNKNKIISLTGMDSNKDGKEDDLISSNLFIGQSLSAIYDYKTDGIYQLGDEIPTGYYPGTYKIHDKTGEGKITTDDKEIIGSTAPAYRFGILNKLTYKDFTLSFFINSVQGGKNGYLGQNASYVTQDDNSRRYNVMSERANLYWSPNNTDGIYSRSTAGAAITPTSVYQDRSFIRLQDVTFSYDLPKSVLSFINIENVNLYVTGKNLFIITKWKGWDPEANYGTTTYGSKSVNNGGSNYDGRPVMKSFTAGINITF